MNAKLRSLHSPDAPDMEGYVPEVDDCFGILVQAMLGPTVGQGEEAFDFMVCSPKWLTMKLAKQESLWVYETLVLPRYDFASIRRAVEGICSRVRGTTWDEVAQQINRYLRWEFAQKPDVLAQGEPD